MVHLDPFGTLVLILTQMIGWAKPVPVDTRYLRNPKRDLFWIASAGPLANLAMALGLGIIIRIGGPGYFMGAYRTFSMGLPMQSLPEILSAMVALCFIINIVLAWFNMIPIPPLDGSKVVMRFLSPEATAAYMQFSRYGFLVLLFLIFAFRGLLFSILLPPVALTGYLFGGIRFF
jgi:Zn-dependent protease